MMLFDAIVNVSKFSPLIAFIVSFLLSAWIFLSNRKEFKNVLFALFGLDLAIWAFSCFIQSITKDYEVALLFDKILYTVAAVAPALFLHCISLFTGVDRKNIIKVSYLAGILFLIINWSPYFRDGIGLNFGMRYVTVPSIGWYLYLVAYTTIVIIAMYDLAATILKSSEEGKKQLLYVLYAFIVLLIGGQSYFILIFKKFNFLVDSILNLSSSIFLAVYNLMMALIITKKRFLNIRVIISRTFAEMLALAFFGAIYSFIVWFYLGYISSRIDLPFILFNFTYGAIMGRTHHAIRLFFQTTSDKLLLKGKYDYYKELAAVGSQITKILSMENILNTLHHAFADIIEVASPRIYLPEDFKKTGIKELTSLTELTFQDNELVLPCRLEDRLIALIILGKKLSEDDYTNEDLGLLKALASQTAVAIDHTRTYEVIKNELEANQEKLYDAERLLARSEKIVSMANLIQEYNHEIRTPLGILRGETERLTDKPRDMAYLDWFKSLALKHIDRAIDIIETTLRLSKPKEHKEEETNLNEVIDAALQLFPPSGVHLTKELNQLPVILGDKDDLQTVFINLIKNAVEAMPDGGNLKISTYSKIEDNKPIVYAEVADTGVGIPQENMEKIFEPFFSTRVTKGRGLGLSIVFRVIREHLAKIEVKSEVGKGSIFKIQFRAKK